MKLLILKMNKGFTTVALLSLALVACGGSVSGYSPASGKSESTVVLKLVPTATPSGGTYGGTQNVTLAANKAGATFYYTTNSVDPTTSSTQYTASIPIISTTTLKILAKGTDGELSQVVTETYTIDKVKPVITSTPNGGIFPSPQYITLSSSKTNTTIYYTTDGVVPSINSKIYTNPIFTGINNTPFTLNFFGKDIAGNFSAVETRNFTFTFTNSSITDLQIENTSSIGQTNVPITFGQVFKEGEVASGTSVAGTLSTGTSIPMQVNVKATHANGSVRHAIISAVLPNLGSGQTETISFTNAAMVSTAGVTPANFLTANPTFSARIDVTVGGVLYRAEAVTLLGGTYIQWLSGTIVNEWIVSGPLLKVSDSTAHPHLEARFAIRSFAGSSKTKVDVTVENNKTFTAGSQNFTYDSKIFVGGVEVDNIAGLNHYHHARWHKSFWWGATPQVHLKHNIDYLLATKAVPNYDRSVTPSQTAIANMVTDMVGKTGPMKVGLALEFMPNTGGRIDIGPLPGWYVLYLLSMDKRAKDVMLGIADGSGSWSIHYRDETDKSTNMPVRIDKPNSNSSGVPYIEISTHANVSELGPLPVPRCGGNCGTPYTQDNAHQPSLAYLPYLVTGDYFYLEELQFWATWNFLETGGIYRDHGKGLVRWGQTRGQAWDLRTLGQVAYITPDTHPLKTYFNTIVANNIAYYNTNYVTPNINQLGIYDGLHAPVYDFNPIVYPTPGGANLGAAPWQDDFFTWSTGYLAELGFSGAQNLLAWKSKFPIARMTNPSYCWVLGAVFVMQVRPTPTSAIYSTIGDAYLGTFGSLVGADGTKLVDKACGSQAQADWLSANAGGIDNAGGGSYLQGQMIGFSTYSAGTPSTMQPALAVAASSGLPGAKEAWIIFMGRSVKPDYTDGPQFAIVPRN